jgi:hypothetical protein
LIQQTVDYFITKAAELNHRFLNRFMISLSSNGLLYFDERVQKFIKKYSNRYRVLALIKTSKVDKDYKIDGAKEVLGLVLIKDKIRKEVI